jgi:chemotaxis protein CheX
MIQNQAPIFREEIAQTVAPIFETMMGLEVIVTDRPWQTEHRRVASSVHLTGSWSGMILLEVSPEQACFFAGRFLSIDTPDAIDDDVRDVLGELANMIGGNLKSAVVPDATLSLPEVVDGCNYSVRHCGATVAARHAFESEAGVFWVSFIQPRIHG